MTSAALIPPPAADIAGVVCHWRTAPEVPRTQRRQGVSLVLCTYRRAASVARFLESVATQTRRTDELIVVDASPDAETEQAVRAQNGLGPVIYWRVREPLRGLTRQRNFGLDQVSFDLVAFFDDDVVLGPTCLEELERVHRQASDLAGVGCFAERWSPPTALWRLRRALRMVPELKPGSYTRGGMSVPWQFHQPTGQLVDGDWLPGCAMMLKTDIAASVRFDSALGGYGQGEDLEFSLRLRRQGRIAIAGSAPCEHFHAPGGRPSAFQLGTMEICNRYRIWRQVYEQPRLLDRVAFGYTWTLDTVLLVRDALRPRSAASGVRRIAGRVVGASQILTGRC